MKTPKLMTVKLTVGQIILRISLLKAVATIKVKAVMIPEKPGYCDSEYHGDDNGSNSCQ